MAGYSYHKQNTNQPDISGSSNQDILTVTSITYSDQGKRDVSFEWFGPWVGIDLRYRPSCNFQLFGNYEYHWGASNLFAVAKISITQTSPVVEPQNVASVVAYRTYKHNGAWGNKGSLGISFKISKNCLFGFVGNYSYWQVNKGSNVNKDETLSISPFPIIGSGRIETASWQSWSILAAIGFDL